MSVNTTVTFRLPATVGVLLLLWSTHSHAAATQQARPTLPLTFEENRGQADKPVKFISRSAAATFFFTPNNLVLSVGKTGQLLRINFAGASNATHITGADSAAGNPPVRNRAYVSCNAPRLRARPTVAHSVRALQK